MSEPIRVLIADDHAMFRSGLRALLEAESHIEVVGEAATGDEAVDQARTLRPNVLLMDLSMHLGDRAVLPDDERRFVIGSPVAHVPAHISPGEHETALRLNSCQQKRQPRG